MRRQLPLLALGRELDERSVQAASCCLDHFGIVEVPDVQKDGHLETCGRAFDLKRDTNLRAAASQLDACHRDLELAHSTTRSVETVVTSVPPATSAGTHVGRNSRFTQNQREHTKGATRAGLAF